MTVELTPRQAAIARLVRRKWTSGRIAEELGISPRTVEVHRANIRLRSIGGVDDPLRHPAVQKVVIKLGKRLAALSAELHELRQARSAKPRRPNSQALSR